MRKFGERKTFIAGLEFFADADLNRRMIGLDIGCKKRKLFPYALGVDIMPLCGPGDALSLDAAEVYGPKGRGNGEHRIAEAFRPAHNICCDARSLPMFADGALDYILSSHALEHISDDSVAVLQEWARVLRPGGLLVVAVPTGDTGPRFGGSYLAREFDSIDAAPRERARDMHRCFFTRESLLSDLLKAGFEEPFWVTADEREIEVAAYKEAANA